MIVGIDLGTTNSLAAVWRGDAAEMVPNALGQLLTPAWSAWMIKAVSWWAKPPRNACILTHS